MTAETAAEVAGWADGLITVGSDPDAVSAVVDAFVARAGPDKPVHLQVHVSWADDEATARRRAVEQWPISALAPATTQDLETPEEMARAAAELDPDAVLSSLITSADLDQQIERLSRLCGLGLERLAIHQVGPDQQRFIDVFGREVLPRLR
jgi:hypothetical protein